MTRWEPRGADNGEPPGRAGAAREDWVVSAWGISLTVTSGDVAHGFAHAVTSGDVARADSRTARTVTVTDRYGPTVTHCQTCTPSGAGGVK